MSKERTLIGSKVIDVSEFVLFLEKRKDAGADIIAVDITNGNHAAAHLGRDTWKVLEARIQVMSHMKDQLLRLRVPSLMPHVEE